MNSHRDFDGLPQPRGAASAIVAWLDREGKGHASVNYRLRDWLLSRQRYWGCPIPIVYCERDGIVPVPEDQLPVVLPDIEDYTPKGQSPLAAAEDWVQHDVPACGGPARRETDTMDTFVDSSWYFLRYCDPHNDAGRLGPRGRRRLDARRPVHRRRRARDPAPDVRALLHARRSTDLGYLDVQEPFADLFTQGMITHDGAKMSKSKGNVISPATYVERYGADTARCYILFIGPPDQDADWSDERRRGRAPLPEPALAPVAPRRPTSGLPEPVPDGPAGRRPRSCCARRTGRSRRSPATCGRFAFNTAIAAVMELVNEVYARCATRPSAGARALRAGDGASLLFPFAPHLAAEPTSG